MEAQHQVQTRTLKASKRRPEVRVVGCVDRIGLTRRDTRGSAREVGRGAERRATPADPRAMRVCIRWRTVHTRDLGS